MSQSKFFVSFCVLKVFVAEKLTVLILTVKIRDEKGRLSRRIPFPFRDKNIMVWKRLFSSSSFIGAWSEFPPPPMDVRDDFH
jgi:hypothetical protein